MDTLGAIIGPLSAVFILQISHHNYRLLFTSTLVPGLIAPAVIAFLVVERRRAPVPHISFGERLRLLPLIYRKFVLAVGLFGAGDFAHTLLILLATQKLSAQLGIARAATIAVSLYVLHNVFYAGFSFFAGWLADRLPKKLLLATGYSLAGAMALGIIFLAANVWTLALIFVLGGVYIAMEETLEDSLCAELVEENHHGMAFGVLASVNGVGDLISSIVVGALWSAAGTSIAFTYSAVLFFAGALLVAWLPVTERAR